MKKLKYLLFGLLGLLLPSCTNAQFDDVVEQDHTEEVRNAKEFTFHVKGDFQTNHEDLTRASVRLEENNSAGVTDIWVFDYDESGNLLQQVHQDKLDTDFGHPKINLTYGHHYVKLIASKGDNPVIMNGKISWTKVKDTFVLDYPVDVVASSNGNRAPELKRVIGCVTVTNTDAIPSNAKSITVTTDKYCSTLDIYTLLPEQTGSFTNTFDLTSSDFGQTGLKFNTYTFCENNEQLFVNVDVTAVATDNTVLSSLTVNDVEINKNRKTILEGEVFNRSNGFSILIDDTWNEALNILFL